ncbi:hypothetical protein D7V91_17045 [bacterium 1xD42-67]|nr:hypothetical protein D7V91_17045 [bacterium 1xD42-67]
MKMSQVKAIGFSLIAVGIILMLIAILLPENWWTPILCILGLAANIGGQGFFFFKWKCPHCLSHLPASGMLGMKHCPYCGNEL